MARKSAVRSLLLAATIVAVLCAALPALPAPLRALGAVPLALWLPGYWLSEGALPDQIRGAAERTALRLGLSLSVCILAGLGLNLTADGLTLNGWVLTLGGTALLASAAALLRGRGAPAVPQAREPATSAASPERRLWPGQRGALLFAAAGLVVAGAFVLVHGEAARQNATDFTQLWILPETSGSTHAAQLGFRNLESASRRYTLELRLNGDLVNRWGPITLAPRQSWQTEVSSPGGGPFAGPLEAVLYRADAPGSVYRRVLLRPAS
ncbi:MAG TPA: DUF1616 domain-containing protein [Dehalococcoidia bacterium]|nr:DUF1616 domain-containing protein [Dehalococcoidia bacterium]